MIAGTKVLVVDLDGTLCPIKGPGESYRDLLPEPLLLARLQSMAAEGWRIVIQSARGMRSHDGNPGEINAHVLPVIIDWLQRPPGARSMSCTWPSRGPATTALHRRPLGPPAGVHRELAGNA